MAILASSGCFWATPITLRIAGSASKPKRKSGEQRWKKCRAWDWKVCPKCKEPYQPDENLLKSLNGAAEMGPGMRFYHGAGCEECNQTGLTGRVGIFELLRITSKLRELIAARPTTEQIMREAPPDHVSMVHDGIDKVMRGITTPEEVFRVAKTIGEDD